MPLPPLWDEHGNVRPEEYEGEALSAYLARIAKALAGGWDVESVVGKQVLAELDGLVRELKAHGASEFMERVRKAHALVGDLQLVHLESALEVYTGNIRAGAEPFPET